MCTECENKAKQAGKHKPIVGALADLESRVDSCRTITSCMLDLLPMPGQGVDLTSYVIDAGNLAAALADVLDLCREDVQRAYEQLKRVD